jgi:enolase
MKRSSYAMATPQRYGGKGTLKAAANVREIIAPAVHGMDPAAVDHCLIELGKTRLGANATLGVSCAVARAMAIARGVPLWQHLAAGRAARLPVPMVNIFSAVCTGVATSSFRTSWRCPTACPPTPKPCTPS